MGHARVFPFAYMGSAARLYLKTGEGTEECQFYHCMSAILYSAFTLEAYLNHVGDAQFQNWAERERKLTPREKLKLVADHLGVPINFGREPFQSFRLAFCFRNLIAHGKTEEIDCANTPPTAPPIKEMPQADWEKIPSLENAQRIVENTHELVRMINTAVGESHDPFMVHKSGARWGP